MPIDAFIRCSSKMNDVGLWRPGSVLARGGCRALRRKCNRGRSRRSAGQCRRRRRVDVVDPVHRLGIGLDVGQVEVDDDRLLPAAAQHARQRLGVAGVDLLVRHERRHVDEVAGTGLGGEFEPVAPLHPRAARHDVDDALDRAVVMRAGLRPGMDDDGAGPQLLRAHPRVRDRRGAVHPRRLRGVGVELARAHDAHAVQAPLRFEGHRGRPPAAQTRIGHPRGGTRKRRAGAAGAQPRFGASRRRASSGAMPARRAKSSSCSSPMRPTAKYRASGCAR